MPHPWTVIFRWAVTIPIALVIAAIALSIVLP